jgi:hypothetical protein
MQNEHLSSQKKRYQIRIEGVLDSKWGDWFDKFEISSITGDETLLTGTVEDQAALHGLLAKIRNLGLSLLSINQVENEAGEQ